MALKMLDKEPTTAFFTYLCPKLLKKVRAKKAKEKRSWREIVEAGFREYLKD